MLSADTRTLCSASTDATARVWDPVAGVCRHVLRGHTGGVTAVAMDSGGRMLCTGGADCSVHLWRLADGKCVRR